LDDGQWADEASLDLCRLLASTAEQLPLLLVLSFRPLPRSSGVRQLQAALRGRGATTICLAPLGPGAVEALVSDIAGAPPGPALVEFSAQASGNPLYVRELVEALVRENALRIQTHAELLDTSSSTLPRSLAAALDSRLSFVPEATVRMLRMATLLGGEFAVTEVAALLGQSIVEISDDLQEAVAAGILVDADHRMRFRHPLIRQALYDGIPAGLRVALHRDAAQKLDGLGGVEPQRIAQQLFAAGRPGDRWALRWLVATAPALVVRAPRIAAELLRQELDHGVSDEHDRCVLSMAYAHLLVGAGRHEQAAARARQAIASAREPADRGQMYWMLVRTLLSGGDNEAAAVALEHALAQPDLPDAWRARMLASLAMVQRAAWGALDDAESTAHQALQIGESTGDTFAIAYALTDLWLNHSVRRQHVTALGCSDRALDTLDTSSEQMDLRVYALHARIFSLQNLSRWSDAETALRQERQFLHDSGRHADARSSVTAAVLMYWLGRWDDSLAELDLVDQRVSAITYRGLRERGPLWLGHGLAALVAARRDERTAAAGHLQAGLRQQPVTVADRENTDFLVYAQALAAEQSGDRHLALALLSGFLERQPGEMTLIHQWLPAMTRLALAVDDRAAATAALEVCRREAAMEQAPGRATAAADWCTGLHGGDAALLQSVVDRYRAVGAVVELAEASDDLAVALAGHGDIGQAKRVMGEALDLYDGFGALWDIRRAEATLRRYGIRRGVRGTRAKRATHGWEALTPTEHKIAILVAAGQSTSQIAQGMFLTRRTTQTHISHILAKLGMRSRGEIAPEAFHRDPDAFPSDL
jgi:DNA-binding CsgD family transcriptional regulator